MTVDEFKNLNAQTERKYKNQPTVVDGIRFDSKAEARRYSELRILEKGNRIQNLQRQSRFELKVNKVKIGTYVADFTYTENGTYTVEDLKGGNATKTPVYKLKKKLMEALYGIKIREVS